MSSLSNHVTDPKYHNNLLASIGDLVRYANIVSDPIDLSEYFLVINLWEECNGSMVNVDDFDNEEFIEFFNWHAELMSPNGIVFYENVRYLLKIQEL